MKTLYRDCKQAIYDGTSVSFMVILFGALGAGLFFFLQNFVKLDHGFLLCHHGACHRL